MVSSDLPAEADSRDALVLNRSGSRVANNSGARLANSSGAMAAKISSGALAANVESEELREFLQGMQMIQTQMNTGLGKILQDMML